MYNQRVSVFNKEFIHVTGYQVYSLVTVYKELGASVDSEYPMIWLVHLLGIQMCGFTYNDILIKVFTGSFQCLVCTFTWPDQI